MTFSKLNLSARTIAALPPSVSSPTEIQIQAIPPAMKGKDVLALAQTGSGKTFAYGIPLIEHVNSAHSHAQAIVLVPTRELAFQVKEAIASVSTGLGIQVEAICGGIDKETQLKQIENGAQIIVATTGRLLDLLESERFNVDQVQSLVFDEADRLLEMGFWPDVQNILARLPKKRQTMMFSATLPKLLESSVEQILFNPVRIEAHVANSVVETINETLYLVNKGSKTQALIALLQSNQWKQVLVFIGAKDNADALTKKVTKAGITVSALHGNKSQEERENTLNAFKNGEIEVLIATDVLARGVHIDALPTVINFDLPNHAPVYVHRVGRTARSGESGIALSLVCHGESEALEAIRNLTGRTLPLASLEGFPVTDKPATGERKRPPRDKQANRRSAKKRSIKQFKPRTNK